MPTNNFNPVNNLKCMKDANGYPLMEALENNGIPVFAKGPDGKNHRVFVPRRYLDVNGYREWFWDIYPDGAISVIDMASDSENATTKVEVRLYADRCNMERSFIANSFGFYKPKQFEAEIPEFTSVNGFELAQATALKNAMSNAGFVFTPNEDILSDEASFIEYTVLGEPVDLLANDDSTSFTEYEVAELISAASEEVLTEEKPDEKKEKSAASGILAYMQNNPSEPEKSEPENTVEETHDSNTVVEELAESEIAGQEPASEEVTVTADIQVVEEAVSTMTPDEALNVIVEVLPEGLEKFGKFAGKTVSDAFTEQMISWIAGKATALTNKLGSKTLEACSVLV